MAAYKKVTTILFCGFLMSAPAAARSEQALTLEDAFRFALARSEALAISGEGVKQLEAAQRQLGASFRPVIAGLASQTAAQGAPGRAQAALNLNYNLFSGMRDYLTARAAGSRTKAAGLEQKRARQNLYLDVAASCIDLYARRREITVRRAQLEVTAGRVKELENRAAIGRSRQSEVVAAQAQLAQDQASLASALAEENSAQIVLSFLTGLDGPLAPVAPDAPSLPELTPYLQAARLRPDAEAARHAHMAAEAEASAARRLGLPSLDLGANYYLRRPSPDEDNRWDAGLTLRVPLYTGGHNTASGDRYAARLSAAAQALALTQRLALTEVKQAYSSLRHSLLVRDSLRAAMALAQENAGLQSKDYLNGLVTNLDVLNAQNTALQTTLSLEQASAAAALAAARLETASGLAPEVK